MPPGRGRRGEDGCTEQGQPPATGHQARGRDAPSHSSPPFPTTEISSQKKQKRLQQEDEQQKQPPASVPEDSLVEILSRVPYKSLCRFKCVSKPWLALCSASDIRRRSPQTLSGFFHFGAGGLQFRNLSGTGPPMINPSLPFLRERYERIYLEQCCSSLLLCQCWESSSDSEEDKYDYIVCNPATEKWTVLPPIVLPDGHLFNLNANNMFLGFDAAAPSCFVVFAPLGRHGREFAEAAIYSSETGQWTSVQSEWGNDTTLFGNTGCVFLNGTVHLTTLDSSVATVDKEGKVWRKIKMPTINDDVVPSIGQSQGRLYAWQIDNICGWLLDVWILEDHDNGKWTLKHTVDFLEIFGRHCHKDFDFYSVFAIHPENDLIFLSDGKEMTVSYDMDNQEVHVICTSQEFLHGLPYTPCFAE